MVGRFVQQQQVRLLQKQLGQRQPHLPAAGERLRRTLEVLALEPQALQHRRRLQLDRVSVAEAELILKVAVASKHRFVVGLGHRGIAQPILELVHLGLHVEQTAERAARLLEDRVARVGQAVLREGSRP